MYNLRFFFRSSLWFGLGVFLNRLKYVFLSILLLKTGLHNLAIFYLTIFFANQLSIFSNRLVGARYNSLLREGNEAKNERGLNEAINSSLQTTLIFGFLGALIIFSLSNIFPSLLRESSFGWSLKIISLVTPFLFINAQIAHIFSLLTRYQEGVIFRYFFEPIVTLLFVFFGIFLLKGSIFLILILYSLAIFLSSFLAIILLLRSFPFLNLSGALLPINFSLKTAVLINALASFVFSIIDILLLGYFLGVERLGYYVALLVAPRFLLTMTTSPFSMFTQVTRKFLSDFSKISFLAQIVMKLVLVIAIFGVIPFYFYPQEMVQGFLQIHVKLDSPILRILILAFFLRVFSWMGSQILSLEKGGWKLAMVNMIIVSLALVLFFLVIPRYGILGAAVCLLLLALLESLLKIILVQFYAKVIFVSAETLKILFIFCLFSLCIFFLPKINFQIFLFVFGMLFPLIVWYFKFFNEREVKFIKAVFRQNPQVSLLEER